jgi:hypothetical protein
MQSAVLPWLTNISICRGSPGGPREEGIVPHFPGSFPPARARSGPRARRCGPTPELAEISLDVFQMSGKRGSAVVRTLAGLLELQEIEDASRSLGRLHRLSGEVKARAQSLPKSGALRNRATPRDAKGLPDEIGLAEMRGMASNALARRAGRLCAPDSIISCPVLRGHVHLALRFL